MSYAEKLKDPRWQKVRLVIMERDGFACQLCDSNRDTLNVHHIVEDYSIEPWDHEDLSLITVCETCHSAIHSGNRMAKSSLLKWLDIQSMKSSEEFMLTEIRRAA